MSSDPQSSSSSTQSQDQSNKQRRPAVLFESLPSIKIITPPKGQFSPKVDERCMTYCSQTISGRIHQREPQCYSLCVRNVFLHEVRNVIAFKSHRNVDSNGHTKYPLPPEGQERLMPSDTLQPPAPKETKYWEDGLYVWFSKSRWAAQEHMSMMSLDLAKQKWVAQQRINKRAVWNEYQEYLKKQAAAKAATPTDSGHEPIQGSDRSTEPHPSVEQEGKVSHAPDKWWGPIVPPHPGPDLAHQADVSFLIHPVAPVPVLYSQVKKLLQPSFTLLDLAHESIVSGAQKKFWLKAWEKAWTKEPFTLANRTIQWSIDKFKESEESESDPKQ